jgi:hypothetical protein
MRVTVSASRAADWRCPYCHAHLAREGATAAVCGGCRTPYHADCLRELGRCGLLGCARPLAPARPRGVASGAAVVPLALCAALLALVTMIMCISIYRGAWPTCVPCLTGPGAIVCAFAALVAYGRFP